MNWEALRAVGEIVGAVAVIATLGYLAVQIRQNTRSVRASMYQSLVESVVNFNTTFTQDSELARAYFQGLEDLQGLSETDRNRVVFALFSHFQIFQSMFYQRRLFTIEPEYWESWRVLILSYYAMPGVQQWWQIRQDVFSKEFRNFLEFEKLDRPMLSAREMVQRLSSKQDAP
jgi:hypothetical protein